VQRRHLHRPRTTARLGLAHWFSGNLYAEGVQVVLHRHRVRPAVALRAGTRG
jgi:hypothetical protein